MHVRHPPAHIITSQYVTYTRQHTRLCVLNPAAHTWLLITSFIPHQHTYFQANIRRICSRLIWRRERNQPASTHIRVLGWEIVRPAKDLTSRAVAVPVKERMPVILVAHVYGTVYPPAHTFVHDLSIIPLAHMFQGGNKLSLQHTSLSETSTKTANKY